jgi:putative Mg2+ transporter-C (MgtC) family protein
LHFLSAIPTLTWPHVLLRLTVAAVLGGAIGMERELRERQAGLRTHLLVCVGSALFTLVSAYGFRGFDYGSQNGIVFDPTRIAAQIVTGIGFLGAGAIIRQGLSVRGLTTAATLWIAAAIGLAAGAGYYSAAIVTTAAVLIALGPLRYVARRTLRRLRHEEGRLVVELRPGESGASLLEILTRAGARPQSLEFAEEHGRRRVAVDVALAGSLTPAEVVADLLDHDEILGAEWAE